MAPIQFWSEIMSPTENILVVDDDQEIRQLLARYLSEQGFRVTTAADRRECESRITDGRPDLIVLDVMLPDGSGLDICRNLRDRRPAIPVILLTALKEDVDRIIGLELGADDYLGKPFNPRELVARIKAILRRTSHDEATEEEARLYCFSTFEVDTQQRSVVRDGCEKIELTGGEFDLLRVFLDRPGRLLTRDQILDLTQGRDYDPVDRSVDVLMSRLRKKMGSSDDTPLFKTVRNGGYQLTAPVTRRTVPR